MDATENQPHYKVLLVDDERFLLNIYSIKFLHEGFDVYACMSAEKGIGALENGFQPDVILFDITMPDMSGYQFLEKLKQMPQAAQCLKIALTNESQEAEVNRAFELGADAHIMKAGYTPLELVTLIRELLKKQRR